MEQSEIVRPLVLGVTAGMRSQMALALVALAARRGNTRVGSEHPWRWLRSPKTGVVTGIAAAGEVVGDKLPMAPSRLQPGPLGGRLVIGALVGAAVSPGRRGTRVRGALLGAVGACAGAYGGYHARGLLGRTSGLPDPLWALAEDGTAAGIGMMAIRR